MGRKEFIHVPAQEEAPKGFNTLFWTGVLSVLFIPFVYQAHNINLIFFSVDFGLLVPGFMLSAAMIYGAVKSQNNESFVKIFFTGLWNFRSRNKEQGILSGALKKYDQKSVEGAQSVLGLAVVFSMITFFWALYDQHGSTWVLQAKDMNLNFMGMKLLASQNCGLESDNGYGVNPSFFFCGLSNHGKVF